MNPTASTSTPQSNRSYFARAFHLFGVFPLHYMALMVLAALSGTLTFLPIMSRLFTYLILQPLITGIYTFAHNQAIGEVPLFMDFFAAFSKRKYVFIVLISALSSLAMMGLMAGFAYILFADDFATLFQLITQDSALQNPDAMQDLETVITSHVSTFLYTLLLAIISYIPLYFIAGYTAIHVMIKGEGITPALAAAIAVLRTNLLKVIGFVLLSYLFIALGFALCFVGVIVAMPIVNIAFVYAFLDWENKR